DVQTSSGSPQTTATDTQGRYRFDVSPGRYQVAFALINFATVRKTVNVATGGLRVDVTLHLSLSADVTVTGKSTFTNLADAENLPTHAHGHGYSDLNSLIPELVTGVQFSKGPYFADQGDFATAGAANINYANTLARPIVRIGGGDEGFARAVVAVAPSLGVGH